MIACAWWLHNWCYIQSTLETTFSSIKNFNNKKVVSKFIYGGHYKKWQPKCYGFGYTKRDQRPKAKAKVKTGLPLLSIIYFLCLHSTSSLLVSHTWSASDLIALDTLDAESAEWCGMFMESVTKNTCAINHSKCLRHMLEVVHANAAHYHSAATITPCAIWHWNTNHQHLSRQNHPWRQLPHRAYWGYRASTITNCFRAYGLGNDWTYWNRVCTAPLLRQLFALCSSPEKVWKSIDSVHKKPAVCCRTSRWLVRGYHRKL